MFKFDNICVYKVFKICKVIQLYKKKTPQDSPAPGLCLTSTTCNIICSCVTHYTIITKHK